MIPFFLVLLAILAAALGVRLLWLRHSLYQTAAELRAISEHLEENRILRLPFPDHGLEQLQLAINQNLQSIRGSRLHYHQEEQKLREEIENISHDLRTPLTAVLGYLKMMDTTNLSETDREYLAVALRKSQSLQNLISQFYDLSRITSRDFHPQREALDSARLLQESCLDHYQMIEKAGLQLSLQIPDTVPSLSADPDALNRIFSNLLQNGIRYGKSRLLVSLDTDPAACSLCFRFSNDILPEQKLTDPARLFERFYMQEPSRSQGGTGLGLTIARRLTESMGGTILAACEMKDKADYLTITLTFPV